MIRVETTFSPTTRPQLFKEGNMDSMIQTLPAFYKTLQTARMTSIEALLTELPSGSYLAGDFLAQVMHGRPTREFTLHFASEEAFLNTIKRIQNAPEGTFLHGYQAKESIKGFIDSNKVCLTFNHRSKPLLQLSRAGWFDSRDKLLNLMEITAFELVFDTDFIVEHNVNLIGTIRSKELMVKPTVHFNVSIGRELAILANEGWRWRSDYWSSSDRESMIRRWNEYARENNSSEKYIKT